MTLLTHVLHWAPSASSGALERRLPKFLRARGRKPRLDARRESNHQT